MNHPSSSDRIGHTLFWSIGILVALAPYIAAIYRPDFRVSWILPPGNFADNLVIAARHLLLGATFGGWLWYLVKRNNPLKLIRDWWKRPLTINWIWFGISFLVYSLHNSLLLFPLPFAPGELVAACLGRILTAFIVLSLLWLAAHIASLASPHRLRFLPWTIPALLPGVLGADALGIIFWKNSLRFFVNKIDEDGTVNLARQLSAGGFHHEAWHVTAMLVGLAALLCGLCYLSFRLSRNIHLRINFRPQIAIAALAMIWVGLAAEKASGFVWKSRKALRMEHNSYEVHLTPIKPSPGVASFYAVWKPALEPVVEKDIPTEKKHDIFFIIIESTRGDAIQPEHAPFLTRFRDEECQPLGETWAAANATHLSWYSIFNGQIPPYWGDAIDTYRKSKELPPSSLVTTLKNAGYRLEARTVCDLAYNAMGTTNFGHPHALKHLGQADPGSQLAELAIPEREIEIFKQARESLITAPSSGNFHLIALDSPHFGYDWHPDFTPPYDAYDESAMFHAYPSEEDIERVRNRYLNAVSFADRQIEEFISFLKEQNRYDNALIVVTGDHGEEFHEHGSWFHCSSLEKEQTGVPILIKWPRGVKAPARKSASHIDILPTLLDHLDQPPESFAHLPGTSLLAADDEEKTQITITSLTGITGIAMAWERNGYRATFRWKNPWTTQLPDTLHLDDLTGPEGSLNLETHEEWTAALLKKFPDAPSRFFSKFESLSQ